MKKLFFIFGVVFFIAACTAPKQAVKIKENEEDEIVKEDSVEYELETFDSRFETWYSLHNSPSQYRSQSYYEGWNQRYVAAWNYNASDRRKSRFFEPIIGYYPTEDYGFELNHELFYYFQYVERVLEIEIMPGGPKSIVF
jgi:hypothetical protein